MSFTTLVGMNVVTLLSIVRQLAFLDIIKMDVKVCFLLGFLACSIYFCNINLFNAISKSV